MSANKRTSDTDMETASPDPLSEIVGRVDLKHEEQGEWFGHVPEDGKIGPNQIEGYLAKLVDENGNGLARVQVRSRFTKAYTKAEEAKSLQAVRLQGKKRAAFQRRMVAELTARHCVADWEFTDRNGHEIPFSSELCERLLVEPEFRHHREFIHIAIGTLQGDIEQIHEEDQGN